MKKFDQKIDVNEKIEAKKTDYRTPELHEIGRSRDLIQGASGIGPYDGRGYYLQ